MQFDVLPVRFMISHTAAAVAGIMEGWSRHRRPIFMIWNPSTSFSGAMALQIVRSSMWSGKQTAFRWQLLHSSGVIDTVWLIPQRNRVWSGYSNYHFSLRINYTPPLKVALTTSPLQGYWKLHDSVCDMANTTDSVTIWEAETQPRMTTW